MPRDGWRSYQYAYKTRVQYTHRHAAAGRADAGHAKFISMMEQIHQELRHCVQVQTLARTTNKKNEQENTPIDDNALEQLDGEHTADIDSTDHDVAQSPIHDCSNYRLTLPIIHLDIMEENMALKDFQTERSVLMDMYGPLKEYINSLWEPVNNHDDEAKPEVAAIITEAAVVWMTHKEEVLYDTVETFKKRFKKTLPAPFEFGPEDSKYPYFLALKDMTAARQNFSSAYPIALKPLKVRHEALFSLRDQNYLDQMNRTDELLIRLLAEVGLEIVSHLTICLTFS